MPRVLDSTSPKTKRTSVLATTSRSLRQNAGSSTKKLLGSLYPQSKSLALSFDAEIFQKLIAPAHRSPVTMKRLDFPLKLLNPPHGKCGLLIQEY